VGINYFEFHAFWPPRKGSYYFAMFNKQQRRFFMQQQFITVKDVTAIYGVSRTTVWNWTNPKHKQYRPDFPKSYKLGGRTARWKASEIQAHIEGMKHKEGV
jgi:conserved domain protein